jgi:hypothetical protein
MAGSSWLITGVELSEVLVMKANIKFVHGYERSVGTSLVSARDFT